MQLQSRIDLADIIKKRLLALVLETRNPENFATQSKKAVNALRDMYIPPQSILCWIALFGGISYSAWALYAYLLLQGLSGTSSLRISRE